MQFTTHEYNSNNLARYEMIKIIKLLLSTQKTTNKIRLSLGAVANLNSGPGVGRTQSKTSVRSSPVQAGIITLKLLIWICDISYTISQVGCYDIIDFWYHMPMISSNTDITDSILWYHSFDSMISYMNLVMMLAMISYANDIM